MKNFKGILFTLVSVICLLLPTAVHAETQGAITNAERDILNELYTGVTVKGKKYDFDITDITKAENYLKVHQVSDENALKVANYLREARQLILDNSQNVDVRSIHLLKNLIKALPRPVIEQLKTIVLKIGEILNLRVTFYRDGVSVVDPSGTPIYSTEDEIKQTGADYTTSYVALGAVLMLAGGAYWVARRSE
ncbi:LPXTG cell wall anchor domain-containing protein [Enterococcus hirae]|nr:LPXTG cell wall anchor domain-containing protein [Enterococcus hirae]